MLKSSLVIALGESHVSAYLFGPVEGRQRFIARGEVPLLAHRGATVAEDAAAAIMEVERLTGRTLLVQGRPITPEAADLSGVDAVVAVAAPTGTLRVAIVGTSNEIAMDSAPRAVCAAGHEVVATLALERLDLRTPAAVFDAARRLRRVSPDVILLACHAGDRTMQRLGEVAAALGAGSLPAAARQPTVIIAAEDGWQLSLRSQVGDRVPVLMAPPLRTADGDEDLAQVQAHLANLVAERWCAALPGYPQLASWLKGRPLPRDVALCRTFRFLSAVDGEVVWGLDLNRDGCGLYVAWPSACSSFRVAAVVPPVAAARAWLPVDPGRESFEQQLANLLARPHVVPSDLDEALAEASLLRAWCRSVLDDPRQALAEPPATDKPARVIGTGRGTACAPTPAEAALLLLDCAQPVGVGHLEWDAESLLPAVAALAVVDPRAAAEVTVGDGVRRLGTYVAPAGLLREGALAVEGEAQSDDGAALRLEVAAGTLEVLPIPPGRRFTVTMRLVDGLGLGSAWGRRARLDLASTPLGLVVDARGRPLPLPGEDVERRRWHVAARRQLGCWEPGEVQA